MKKRTNPEITPQRLRELYEYSSLLGEIRNKSNNRKLLPDPENGSIVCYDPETRGRQKFLYRNAAYVLGTGKCIPTGQRVLSLNLDEQDIKLCNLKLLENSIYGQIKIALKNLLRDLKITQHPNDKSAYIVSWSSGKQHKQVVAYDYGRAEQIRKQKALEFAKIVNTHIRSTS